MAHWSREWDTRHTVAVKSAKELEQAKRKAKRNATRRAENAMLRELYGTSARAAREDMGL